LNRKDCSVVNPETQLGVWISVCSYIGNTSIKFYSTHARLCVRLQIAELLAFWDAGSSIWEYPGFENVRDRRCDLLCVYSTWLA